MARTTLPNSLRGLVLSAVEIKGMTSWPDALIEDYLSIIENMFTISEQINGLLSTATDIVVDASLFTNILSSLDDTVQKALNTIDQIKALNIKTDTTLFDKLLSAADDTVQKALQTLDEHTHNHSDLTNVLQSNDTSASTDAEKHVTDAQVKIYGDHVRIDDGNPHGTDWNMLEGTINHLPMDTTPTAVPISEGVLSWNIADGCIDIQQYNNTTLQVGQELFFYGKASGAIANGDLCQFAGVQGDHILVKRANPTEVKVNQSLIVGVATQHIANGAFGYITWFGNINGVYTKTPANNDTVDWIAGDLLYFNNSTGYLTKIKPDAPDVLITMAAVIREQTGASENGKIVVRPQLTGKFTDLNDVDGVATVSGQFYIWDNTLKYFKPTTNITIDDATPTITTNTNDLVINCGVEKTIRLEEPVWKDIDFPIVIRIAGAGYPAYATVLGNLTMPRWAVNDFNVCEIQEIIHEWEQGTDIHFHIHMVTSVQDATDRYVNWEIEYNYANIYNPSMGGAYSADMSWQVANSVVTSGNMIIPANTPARTNVLVPIYTWAYAAGKIGAHVKARLRRIAVIGGVAQPSVDPFCEMLQMHVLVDTMGSRKIGTK